MQAFDEIGHAMLLAQEGQAELGRLLAAALSRLVARIAAAFGRTPPTQTSLDRPSRSF